MDGSRYKSAIPFYAAAAVWVIYALALPLYAPMHYALAAGASLAAFFVASALCRTGAADAEAAGGKAASAGPEEDAADPELDRVIRDGKLAIQEMRRLDESITDEGISADILRLERASAKIFEEVRRSPEKLPQIRRFMDYYLPATLKLLNAYDRMSGTGVSGENIDATLARVEKIMRTIAEAFEKQLDSLYGAEAMDISADITVLETMLAREGLTEDPLRAETRRAEDQAEG